MKRTLECEVCDKDISKQTDRCTNRRCLECHSKWCTKGGNDSPGHGRGNPPARYRVGNTEER